MGGVVRPIRGGDGGRRQDRRERGRFRRGGVVRPRVALVPTADIPIAAGKSRAIQAFPARPRPFLVLSGRATGLSWLCRFRALDLGRRGAGRPLDKLSVVFAAVPGTSPLGERLSPINWPGVVPIAAGAVAAAWK